jgi:tRNA G18 (ribose-2'-O)-methylase SpoU
MDKETDTRNLMDEYKGLPNEEVLSRLDKKRTSLEIAIENLSHDFNIGTIVRNANAFNVSKVHILGKRKYNRRGAMVTDKYLHIDHFAEVEDFVKDAHERGMKIIAIDNNRPESKPLQAAEIAPNSILKVASSRSGFILLYCIILSP